MRFPVRQNLAWRQKEQKLAVLRAPTVPSACQECSTLLSAWQQTAACSGWRKTFQMGTLERAFFLLMVGSYLVDTIQGQVNVSLVLIVHMRSDVRPNSVDVRGSCVLESGLLCCGSLDFQYRPELVLFWL